MKKDVNDTLRDEGPDAVRARSDGAVKVNGGASVEIVPFPFTLAKDVTLVSKVFMIDGLLGRHETSVFYGAPETGKSVVVLDMACCVAAGIAYCGRRVEQAPVIYVAVERGGLVKRRLLAWMKEHGLSEIPLAIIDAAVDLRTPGKLDDDRIVATALALEAICGEPAGWIIFDTLNRVLAGGDENSSKDTGAVIAAVDHIHRETGAHCSLIHHVPQDRTDRMRGHGSVAGATDTTVRISKDGAVVRVEVDKANDLVDRPQLAFTFKSVELDPVTTAPVMVPVEEDQPRHKPAKVKLTKAAKIALSALREAIDETGAVPQASNHIPANVKCVSVEQGWRNYAYNRGISAGDKRAQQLAFKRAVEALVADKHVGCWNGQAWIA
jgi:hypothetical protein